MIYLVVIKVRGAQTVSISHFVGHAVRAVRAGYSCGSRSTIHRKKTNEQLIFND